MTILPWWRRQWCSWAPGRCWGWSSSASAAKGPLGVGEQTAERGKEEGGEERTNCGDLWVTYLGFAVLWWVLLMYYWFYGIMEVVSLHTAQNENCISSQNNRRCESSQSPLYGQLWAPFVSPSTFTLWASADFSPISAAHLKALSGLRACFNTGKFDVWFLLELHLEILIIGLNVSLCCEERLTENYLTRQTRFEQQNIVTTDYSHQSLKLCQNFVNLLAW